MRLPRLFAKKRGHRRSGSQAWGSFGEGFFYGVLLVAGLIFGGLLLSGVAVPEWRINHDFVETRGMIVATGLAKRTLEDPPGSIVITWQPCLRIRYAVEPTVREGWSRPLAPDATADRSVALGRLSVWRIGTEVRCWYDPADPGSVVLERGYNWWLWLLTLVLPGALVAFGGSGLMRAVRIWGKSEERRASSAGLADLFDPGVHALEAAPGHPAVPNCDNLVNSPGTILRYRLPLESPENWALLGFGLFAVLWNAVVVVLAVGAGLDLLGGRKDWLLFGLLIPFVLVGVAGIACFVRGLVTVTAVGTSQLEISDHPLRPGGRYDVLLWQAGAGTLQSLAMSIEAEEQATFRQGTDTRTERLVVRSLALKEWRDVHLSPGTRFEARVEIEIPSDAMHSFASEHNAVHWRVVVRGTPDRRPAFARVFPIVVFPGEPAP